MQTDTTLCSPKNPNNTQQCCDLIVVSVHMGLNVYCSVQAHANRRNKSQHFWAQQCWELLALVAWCMQTNATANIVGIKAHANGRNKCQQLPTMLGVVGQQCCVRLHGPKSLTGFKLYRTSANIVVVSCKRTQQVTTLLGPTMLGVVGQHCWVLLANIVGSVCIGL